MARKEVRYSTEKYQEDNILHGPTTNKLEKWQEENDEGHT